MSIAWIVSKRVWLAAGVLAAVLTVTGLGLALTARQAAARPSGACTAPAGTHSTIQQALDDESCALIAIAPGTHTGPLTVTRAVVLQGAGADQTFLDGGNTARVLYVVSEAAEPQLVVVRDVTIQNGYVLGVRGAGIFNAEFLHLSHSRVISNVAATVDDHGGGGLYVEGTAVIDSVEFSGNQGAFGSAIMATSVVTMTNSTLSQNEATGGGTIYMSNAVRAWLVNNTIVSNTAPTIHASGGLFMNTAEVTLVNNVLSNAPHSNCGGGGDSATSLGGNTVTGNDCQFNHVNDQFVDDVMLEELDYYVGPTRTQRPLIGSPVIDTGLNAYCPQKDQRGRLRPVDGDDDDIPECDGGAVELFGLETVELYLPLIIR